MLGDAREIMPFFPDNSIDMIFTDPPYGHNNNNNNDLIHSWEKALGMSKEIAPMRPICNDSTEDAEKLFAFLMEQAPRLLKEESCCCCCCGGGGGPGPMFARWSLKMDQHLTFKQMIVWDKGPMGMGWHYRRSYETILVGHKGNNIPQANEHPTAKPYQLAGFFIELHSQPHDIIFDPFMGGGSTIEAARKAGRRFIGIEIDPQWLPIAVKRLRQVVLNFS